MIFNEGDIVRVRPEWLAKDENPDTEYVVVEDRSDEYREYSLLLVAAPKSTFGYRTHTWPNDTVYKVGHIDPEDIDKFIKDGKLKN